MTRARKDADYEVGYGRPPRQHQFAKGKSPNPKGRPRRNADFNGGPMDVQLATLVLSEADRIVTVRDKGRIESIPVKTALIRSAMVMALQGDRYAHSDVVRLIESSERVLEERDRPANECPQCSHLRDMTEQELEDEFLELLEKFPELLPPGWRVMTEEEARELCLDLL